MTPEQYAAARSNLFARTIQILAQLWANLTGYHTSDVAVFQRDALPVLRGAQRALGQMVAVRVASSASRAFGRPVPAPQVPDELLVDLRQGVSTQDEYRRPFEQTWYGLSTGEDLPAATRRGRIRLVGLADLDLQMTEASAARESMQQTGAQWWKRVPQGDHTCLLCLVASTRVYHVDTLKPLHPACDCGVEEQFSQLPDSVTHDTDLLTQAYDAVKAATGRVHTDAETLRTLLADFTQDSSETGPMLAYPRGVKRTAAA